MNSQEATCFMRQILYSVRLCARRYKIKPMFLSKYVATGLAITLVSTILAGVFIEIMLRIAGYAPWPGVSPRNEVSLLSPDTVLGWRNKPGRFTFAGYAGGSNDITYTFLEDGSRFAGKKPDVGPRVVLVGCSFTQGFAISDHETFSWKLQQSHPLLTVLNYGTAGYGTYQALMLLEQKLPEFDKTSLVIYNFIEHHEVRNVLDPLWLLTLKKTSWRGHGEVPYARLDDQGKLVRYAPKSSIDAFSLPYDTRLALFNILERAYAKFNAVISGTRAMQRPVTMALIQEMSQTVAHVGASFAVVVLQAAESTANEYVLFGEKAGIRVVDCNYTKPGAAYTVEGEGIHPNDKLNTLYAKCIEDKLLR